MKDEKAKSEIAIYYCSREDEKGVGDRWMNTLNSYIQEANPTLIKIHQIDPMQFANFKVVTSFSPIIVKLRVTESSSWR